MVLPGRGGAMEYGVWTVREGKKGCAGMASRAEQAIMVQLRVFGLSALGGGGGVSSRCSDHSI